MGLNRLLGDLAHNLDSAAVGSYQGKSDFATIAYSNLSGTPSVVLDSSLSTQLVDSAYIQARQLPGITGLDSAAAISVVDSNYINLRIGGGGSGFFVYNFETTAGQTAIQDSDLNGNLMSYEQNGILVFKNGVLLLDSDDYTATDGSVVTLTDSADSGSNITISKFVLGGGGGSGGASMSWGGTRGFVNTHGGAATGALEYFDITTPGNAADFGNYSTYGCHNIGTSCTGGSRLLLIGGNASGGDGDEMEYYTTTTLGNGTVFGDLTGASRYPAAASNGTYGLTAVGTYNGAGSNNRSNKIDYVTIATTANAADFGDTTLARSNLGAGQDGTYCLWAGGHGQSVTFNNIIDYVTAATPGNATDFGDLSSACAETKGCSNTTKTLFHLGYTGSVQVTIDQVTTQTAANSTDFGDLLTARYALGACCSTDRAVFCSGPNSSFQTTNIMEYLDFATAGTATDFGDIGSAQEYTTASSGPPS